MDTRETLILDFDILDTTKDGLIKKLNKIDEICSFENEYINNIQNLSLKDYLTSIGKPLLAYPDEPCSKPIWGDNYPDFVDTRVKPVFDRPSLSILKFSNIKFVLFIFFMIIYTLLSLYMANFFTSVDTGKNMVILIRTICSGIFVFYIISYFIEMIGLQKKFKKEMAEYDNGYNSALADYEKEKAEYQNNLIKYREYIKEKEIIDENNNTLLSNAEYNRQYEMYLQEQKDKFSYYQSPQIKREMNAFLHENYWAYCDDIIEIISTGRADTIKEAINILTNDLNAKALLKEQQRQNDILLENLTKQRELQEEANLEQKKYYENQINAEKMKLVENMKYHEDMKKIMKNNTNATALCMSCSKVAVCNHIGKKVSGCYSKRRDKIVELK